MFTPSQSIVIARLSSTTSTNPFYQSEIYSNQTMRYSKKYPPTLIPCFFPPKTSLQNTSRAINTSAPHLQTPISHMPQLPGSQPCTTSKHQYPSTFHCLPTWAAYLGTSNNTFTSNEPHQCHHSQLQTYYTL